MILLVQRRDCSGVGRLFDDLVGRFYDHASREYGAHPQHVTAEAHGRQPCQACAVGYVDGEEARVCGGPDPSDRCDELGDAMFGWLDMLFPADAGRLAALLADTPEAWLWGSSSGWGTVVGMVAAVFREEAEERVFPGGVLVPVLPARARLRDSS